MRAGRTGKKKFLVLTIPEDDAKKVTISII
jgi:hypothetical protein